MLATYRQGDGAEARRGGTEERTHTFPTAAGAPGFDAALAKPGAAPDEAGVPNARYGGDGAPDAGAGAGRTRGAAPVPGGASPPADGAGAPARDAVGVRGPGPGATPGEQGTPAHRADPAW